MKKVLLFIIVIFTFLGCEKSNNGFREVYAEIDVKSSGSNGELDQAILELTSQNPQIVFGVGAHGSNSPMKGKSSVYSMPIGSNLTYNLYVRDWDGIFDGQTKAWSDVTFKIVVGNKVKLLKKYNKGDLNCMEYGNIIID
jgi:hypothetical protein